MSFDNGRVGCKLVNESIQFQGMGKICDRF